MKKTCSCSSRSLTSSKEEGGKDAENLSYYCTKVTMSTTSNKQGLRCTFAFKKYKNCDILLDESIEKDSVPKIVTHR